MAVDRGARILIVDADDSIRYTFERFLANEGYGPISTAATAAEALAQADREKNFDLVICDILLEEEKGPDLLKKLRQAGVDCPVVMITGYPDIESATELIRLGAFDYIAKPITKQTLLHFTALALRHRALQKERNRLQAENERYRRHLEAVFRSVRDAIITVDVEMNIIHLNDRARQWIADFSVGEAVAPRKLTDLPGEFGKACVADAGQVISSRAELREHTIECPTRDKGVRLINLSATPVIEEGGSFSGVVFVARDITASGTARRKAFG
ncbi:MAG: response regulator, partial [Desulfobulbaceae bacterium]|nr:response regulator [Desulfobulbaceae bacterium]